MYRGRLEAIVGLSEATMKLRDERLQAIRQQISQLESKVSALNGRIDDLIDMATLRRERDAILRAADRYDDTPYAATVTQALQRIEALQQYLLELATVQTSIDGNLRDQSDVQYLRQQIYELRTKYGMQLTARQLQGLDDAVLGLNAYVETQTNTALVWLQEREAEYNTATSAVLQKKRLQNMPAFLPRDKKHELDELISNVQKKIDADIVMSIEQKFLEITDFGQRRICIQRLEQLLQPMTYPAPRVDGHR